MTVKSQQNAVKSEIHLNAFHLILKTSLMTDSHQLLLILILVVKVVNNSSSLIFMSRLNHY